MNPLLPARNILLRIVAIPVALGMICSSSIAADLTAGSGERLRLEALQYEHGEGVAKDPLKAVELYCEAVRAGDAPSAFNLGWIYANARGVERDDSLAAYFFSRAVALGDAGAQAMLDRVGSPTVHTPTCMEDRTSGSRTDLDDFTDVDKRVLAIIRRLSPQYGVNPRLAAAVIRAESNFDDRAVSPKNAQGLMQLIPDTSTRFNVRKPFDPEQNIRGGMSYLRWLLAYFKGNVTLVAAAYNAGEGTVNKYRGVPPYLETRAYVQRILLLFGAESHPYDPTITDPSPDLPKFGVRRRSA